jgi:hypothetical protein
VGAGLRGHRNGRAFPPCWGTRSRRCVRAHWSAGGDGPAVRHRDRPRARRPVALSPARAVGLVVGRRPGVIVAGPGLAVAEPAQALGAIAQVLLVALLYAIAPFIIATKLAHVPSLGTITLSLLAVGLAYLPFALLTQHELPTVRSGLSLVALGILCTALAFLGFFALIGEVGPARAPLFTYVNPSSRSCWCSCSASRCRRGCCSAFRSCSSAAGSPRRAVGCVCDVRRRRPRPRVAHVSGSTRYPLVRWIDARRSPVRPVAVASDPRHFPRGRVQ